MSMNYFQDHSQQKITQPALPATAVKQTVTGHSEPEYMLYNLLTAVPICQLSQVPTVARVTSPTLFSSK